MLGVRSCGKRKSKALSSADISFPFDFRIETHIEAESTVTQVISFVNNATLTHRNRPNLLAPNPNWPTVGQRQRLSRGPLTEEELERSPFGKYLIDLRQPSDARLFPTYGSNQTDPTPLGGDAGTVPTTPIPRAPTRYRNRLPSPWMNNGPHAGRDDHASLERTHSKSLPQITRPFCETRGCHNCEVCKQGTITSSIYFPMKCLRSREGGSQQDVNSEKSNSTVVEEEYDEILSRENTRIVKLRIPNEAPATLPRSAKSKKPAAPCPPPRGVPAKKPPQKESLELSPVDAVSICFPSPEGATQGSYDCVENPKKEVSTSVSGCSRDSGVWDDDETRVTRL